MDIKSQLKEMIIGELKLVNVTPEQTMLVEASWEEIEPLAPRVGEAFYGRFFDREPETRSLFSTDIAEQGTLFMSMLGVAVKMAGELETIGPLIADLGRRHERYGVTARYYQSFREALLDTFAYVLGGAFTPQVREAWAELVSTLSARMLAVGEG